METQETTTRPFLVVHGANITGVKKPTSYIETLIHAIKAYVGSGIFAMGAALMNSGMLLGPLLLLVIALINLHCQHLLIKACVKIAEKEAVLVQPSFAETVQYTFEDKQETTRPFLVVRGANVTGVKKPTHYLETLTHAIKGNVGTGIFAMGAGFMNSGMLLGPLLLIFIGVVNLHCQHILINACIKITDKEPVPVLPSFAETVQYTFEDCDSQWLKKYSKAFGITTDVFLILAEYGFCVVYFIFVSRHLGEIVPLRMEMRNPDSFSTPFGVLNVAMVVVVALYLLVGVFSFWMWGDDVKGSAFLNLPQEEG
ncbi:hypothetical protein TcasGA2_TC034996 [Tribolium castaneum]|uniref:Amino acid transporter transmembrane domain-containing protein n=1 Tax=Tribolium castaneum TaxID=7070 RepID=A0A139W972_TRICA|nr:hypothetical protein TcasGA2_TC034996 [Tribolium castaneum]